MPGPDPEENILAAPDDTHRIRKGYHKSRIISFVWIVVVYCGEVITRMRKFHPIILMAILFLGLALTPHLLASGEQAEETRHGLLEFLMPFAAPRTQELDEELISAGRARWQIPQTPTGAQAETPSMELVWSVAGSAYQSAWGDINGDGRLDLVVARGFQNHLYLNVDGELETTPSWVSRSGGLR